MSLPGLPATSGGLVVLVTTAKTSALLAGGGQAAKLTMLVDWVDDPVDAGILADGLVLWVDEDDLVVLVGGVLVDPVRVENAQVSASATDTLLGGGLEGALELELVHTLVGGLAWIVVLVEFPCAFQYSFAYRRWHPLALVACDLRGGRGHGR